MKPTIDMVRAVGAEFAKRALRPLVIIGLIVLVALHAAGAWLTNVNAWWWLLEAVFIFATVLFVAVLVAVSVVLRLVAPPLTKTQKPAVANFVDKLQRVAENAQTPYPLIIFYVVRDVLRPKPNGFIGTISQDSKTLAPDVAKLRRLFE